MYTLHTSAGSGGFAVHAVLAEAGEDCRIVHVDTKKNEQRKKSFLKLNPMAQVPVLTLPDGTVMTESAAMVIHLADMLAGGKLAPKPGSAKRATYLRWLTFMAVNPYTADLRYFYSDRYTTDPGGAEAVKAAALRDMEDQFAILDKAVGQGMYLLGNSFSAADPYLLMLCTWHPDPAKLLAQRKNLGRLCQRVKARKAIAPLNEFHKLW
ncbi:MAG: glutathione S-transferase family protein [Parvibaculaceae bacterium]